MVEDNPIKNEIELIMVMEEHKFGSLLTKLQKNCYFPWIIKEICWP